MAKIIDRQPPGQQHPSDATPPQPANEAEAGVPCMPCTGCWPHLVSVRQVLIREAVTATGRAVRPRWPRRDGGLCRVCKEG